MDAADLPALSPERTARLRAQVRDAVRGWLIVPDPADGIASIGAQAIEAAAEQSRRLAVQPPPAVDPARLLDRLRRLAEGEPAPARGWLGLRRPPPPAPPSEAVLATLLADMATARDDLLRQETRLAGDMARLTQADARLEEAAQYLRGLAGGAEAAAREVAVDDPARAATLRGAVAGALDERLRDVLTQLAVTRQARLSLDLIAEGNRTLAAALDRSRLTMAAALRTAGLAGRAVAEGRRLAEQADALDRSSVAAGAAGADRAAAVRRALDDALAQVAAAIAAAQAR